MEIFKRLRSAFSERDRLMRRLAEIAGRCEVLVERLRRHGGMCVYPALADGVRALAAIEARHERVLRSILAERECWPRQPEFPPREGANNWERLSGDTVMLLAFARELHRHALEWEGEDPALAERLAQVAAEADESEAQLRALSLKCDPQALD
jgi:hypothetical protein